MQISAILSTKRKRDDILQLGPGDAEKINYNFDALFFSVTELAKRLDNYSINLTTDVTGTIDLTTSVSGVLPISHGGTNSSLALSGSTIMISSGTAIVQGPAGTTTTVLHGNPSGAPDFSSVVEGDMSLSNVSTNNATTSRHGFLQILPNDASKFLNGQGNFVTPTAANVNAYLEQAFSGVTTVTVIHNFGVHPVVQVVASTGFQIIPLEVNHTSVNQFTVTFTSATTGNVQATVGSPQFATFTTTATNYAVLSGDYVVSETSSGTTLTLPTAVGVTGKTYILDNDSIGSIFVTTTGGQTIEGQVTQLLPSNSAMQVISNGSGWRII